MNENDLREIENSLIKANLMEENDTIEKDVAGDYWSFINQIRGHYYFTRERVIFVSGWGVKSFSIKYSDIRAIKKSLIGLFMPFGVTVTADMDGQMKNYKFSLLNRNQWMEFLANKSGVLIG